MKTYQFIRHACIVLAALLLPLTLRAQGTQPTEGDGTAESPYQIATADNLLWFNAQCNAQPTARAVLVADIDMEGKDWIPVRYENGKNYAGTFDGQGHTLKNLNIKAYSYTYNIGMFAKTIGATIRNIVFDNPQLKIEPGIYSASSIGIVVGQALKTVIEGVRINGGELIIQNYSSYDTYFQSNVGSIVGTLEASEIRSCTNSADIQAPYYAGGIVGTIKWSKLTDCANHGKVTGQNPYNISQNRYIGGIAGEVLSSTLKNVLNTGNLVRDGSLAAGLFVGKTSADTEKAGDGAWLCGSDVKYTDINGGYEWTATAVGSGTLNTLAGEDITTIMRRVTPEQLQSGEAAWLLNGQTATPKDGSQPVWQQRLGQDARPEPRAVEGGIVWCAQNCQTGKDSYTNDGENVGTDGRLHQYELTQTEGIALYRWVCTACQSLKSDALYIKDFSGQTGYNLPLRYNADASFTALEPVKLADATAYNSPVDFTAEELTYSRSFTSKEWQPLFVPFDLPTSQLPEGVEVAVLSNFHEYKADGKQAVELEVRLLREGTVPALTPCVIRNSNAQPLELQLSAAAMAEAKGRSIDCWSMKRHYTFTGTMEGKNEFDPTRHFVMKDGQLYRAKTTAQLRGQRWYLTATDRTGSTSPAAPQCITIRVADDDATAIGELHVVSDDDAPASEGIYDLQGRRLHQEPVHGVYIKNGKKYVK